MDLTDSFKSRLEFDMPSIIATPYPRITPIPYHAVPKENSMLRLGFESQEEFVVRRLKKFISLLRLVERGLGLDSSLLTTPQRIERHTT
jgi:hypothetical protein